MARTAVLRWSMLVLLPLACPARNWCSGLAAGGQDIFHIRGPLARQLVRIALGRLTTGTLIRSAPGTRERQYRWPDLQRLGRDWLGGDRSLQHVDRAGRGRGRLRQFQPGRAAYRDRRQPLPGGPRRRGRWAR